MQIAEVIGTVVSTRKNKKFEGAKLLLVQNFVFDDAGKITRLRVFFDETTID